MFSSENLINSSVNMWPLLLITYNMSHKPQKFNHLHTHGCCNQQFYLINAILHCQRVVILNILLELTSEHS